MKISNFKIIIWLIVIILFLITCVVFSKTLALFENNAVGTADSDIGNWVIKINNQLISSGLTQNITVNNFVYDNVSTVQGGYIAPGTSAYFILVFDATGCDVAVRYDITFDLESMLYADNISVTVEEVGTNNTVLTDENTYSGIISLAQILSNTRVQLKVNVTWNDLPAYNDDDTALGTQKNSKLAVPIIVHAEQYMGETLVPYVPPTPDPGE